MSTRHVFTSRDELTTLRARATHNEIERSKLTLAAATANRRAVNAQNCLRFIARRVRVFLSVAPGRGRDAAERELLADLEQCEKGATHCQHKAPPNEKQ